MRKTFKNSLILTILMLSVAAPGRASVVTVATQAEFSALGTISQNTNWDSFTAPATHPGNNYVVGDLTFVAGPGGINLIGGKNLPGYNLLRNLFTDDNVKGTTIDISGSHDLFAVNAALFFDAEPGFFDVTTTAGFYQFAPQLQNGADALTFFGLRASPGEYFKSVRFYGPNGKV